MSDLAILVPVLGRPHRVRPLLDSIEASVPGGHVVFLADPTDHQEVRMVRRCQRVSGLDITVDTVGGSYAVKINRGVRNTTEPFIFTAADDLEPQPGWFEAARRRITDEIGVIGVNDLIPRKRAHATHFLLSRAYAELPAIDDSSGPFFEGYSHWWCDDELIATASHRRAYAYASDAEVLHLHPMTGGAEDDATYRRGRARRKEDRKLFESRSHLWV